MSHWLRYGLCFALLLLLLLPLTANAAPGDVATDPNQATDPAEEPTFEDPDDVTISSTNIQMQVEEAYFALTRPGQTFPIDLQLTVIDSAVHGQLEIAIPGQPLLVQSIDLMPPSTQRLLLLSEAPSQGGFSYSPWGQAAPSQEIVISIRQKDRILLRERFDLFSSTGHGVWGEITGQIPVLRIVAPVLQIETPLNGMTPERLRQQLEEEREQPYTMAPPTPGSPTPLPEPAEESLPLESGPPMLQSIERGGFDLPGAYASWDLIFVHGQDPREWDAPHIAALQDWVLDGGVLLLAPGTNVDWSPWSVVGLDNGDRIPASQRPVGPVESLVDFLDAPPFVDYPQLDRFDLPEGMEPLVLAGDGQPLLGWRAYGRGCIVGATFDVAHPSMRDWPGLPRLLQFMADWGARHRVNEQNRPGLVACETLSTQGSYGSGQMPMLSDAQRLGLMPFGYSQNLSNAPDMGPSLWFLGAYALVLVMVLPSMRTRHRWRLMSWTWAGMLVASLTLLPALYPHALSLTSSRFPIASPAAPVQEVGGFALRADRGLFAARVPVPGIELPRLSQLNLDMSVQPNNMRVNQGRQRTVPPFEWHAAPESAIEKLDLPFGEHLIFEIDQLPTSRELGLRISHTSTASGSIELQIEKTDAQYAPEVVLALAAVGGDIRGLRSATPSSDRAWPMSLILRDTSMDRSLTDQPEIGQNMGYWAGPYGSSNIGEPLHLPTGSVIPGDVGPQLEWLDGYAMPLRDWVDLNGGTVVLTATLPDPEKRTRPDIRIWYDPTPNAMPGILPLMRLGYSQGIALTSQDQKLHCRMSAGGILELHPETAFTSRQPLLVKATPLEAAQQLVLEQWTLDAGWVARTRTDERTDETAVWELIAPHGTPSRSPIYRLRAPVPVEIQQLLIPDFQPRAAESQL